MKQTLSAAPVWPTAKSSLSRRAGAEDGAARAPLRNKGMARRIENRIFNDEG